MPSFIRLNSFSQTQGKNRRKFTYKSIIHVTHTYGRMRLMLVDGLYYTLKKTNKNNFKCRSEVVHVIGGG